jgi:PAS domain S-box-containing protein
MKKKNDTISLVRWIWLNYVKTALIPLILVELVFVSIFFAANNWTRQEMLDFLKAEVDGDLSQISILESSTIQEQLNSITYTVKLYAEQTSEALSAESSLSAEDASRLAYNDDGAYYTTNDSSIGGAAIFYSGYVPIGLEEREKVARLLQTQELMKSIQLNYPLAASIYFNTYDSLNIIYPYFDVISQYPSLMDIPTYNFYYEADSDHNPERLVQWTDIYLDPAGHGWMASCIAPVYDEDFLQGVVGIDITVGDITEQVLNMDIPWGGYGILVGQDGTILALPEKGEKEWGLSELTDHSYDEAIMEDTFKPEQFNLYNREDLTAFSEEITKDAEGISSITLNGETKIVSWQTISETGWMLMLIIPEQNIYASINSMTAFINNIGRLMILGLIVFYLCFFAFLYTRARKMSLNISQPLIELNNMVESIGNGNYHQHLPMYPVEELNKTSQNLVTMGEQLGEAYQNLLTTQNELKENEKYLEVLIDSIDDVILEIDENGKFLSVRTKDRDNLATNYLQGNSETIHAILPEAEAEAFIESMQRVIQTGETETMEYQLETPKGHRWFQARLSLIPGKNKVIVSARDITAHIVMEQSIINAKNDAEKANQAKSQFLSNMSHELRTPLNAVLGFTQLLDMDESDPLSETKKEYVMEIEKAGHHLLELINEVLDLTKVESGKSTISMEPVFVGDIMNETLSMLMPLANDRDLTVETRECECRKLYIEADYMRLKQVLINLLSNAVKYNKEHGKINYYCERIDDKLRFHIIDTGIGIPSDELKNIFHPFHRLSQSSQTVQGTGIGLTLVKQLTEMMNGRIRVESELGQGSHFYFDMNIMEPDQIKQKTPPIDMSLSQKEREKKIYKMLYVEDNPANLALIEHVIHKYPFITLTTAKSAEDGLVIAEETKPDLILLDINLPKMDGYEMFKVLKKNPDLSPVSIIALSANAMKEDKEKAIEMGFYDYLTKPIDVAMFTETIMKALFQQNEWRQ